jgi:hypothetical protein
MATIQTINKPINTLSTTQQSYTAFNKTAKTITLDNFLGGVTDIVKITDKNNGTVIWDKFATGSQGTLLGQVLTLTYNTSTAQFANTDTLEIFIDPKYATEKKQDDLNAIQAQMSGNIGNITDIKAVNDDSDVSLISLTKKNNENVSGVKSAVNNANTKLQSIDDKLANTATTPLNVTVTNPSTGGGTEYDLGTPSIGNEKATAIFGIETSNGNRRGIYFDGIDLLVKDKQMGNNGNAITQPTGGFGVLGWLSGIYKRVSEILIVDQTKIAGTNIAVNTGVKDAGTQRITLATDDQVNTTLTNILAEMRDDRQIAETVWYDKLTPTLFYVRRATVDEDTGTVTISFQNVDGTTATPTTANLVQANAQSDIETVNYQYKVITAGTGYAIGDNIQELQMVNPVGTVQATVWFNRTQNTVLATAPTFAHLTESTLAATSALQTTGNTSLASIDTNQGAKADTEATTNTGSFSLISLVKRLLNTTLAFGQKTMAGSLPVTIASDQTPLIITQGKTEYVKSIGNSSTTQLPSTATFPGAIVDVLAYPSIIVSSLADQPTTINIFQYIDLAGTQLVGTSTFTRLANQPFNSPVKLNGNYAKVAVQNTGLATTTTFVVDTYLGSMEILPTELTSLGNLKVAIMEGAGAGGGAGTQLFRASAVGTGYAVNDLLEFNGTAWRNIMNPAAITTLATPPAVNTVYPVIGGIIGNNGTVADGSGSITAANSSLTLFAANPNRQSWRIQNTSGLDLYVNDLGSASQLSYRVQAGAEYTPPYSTTGLISILGTQVGQTFTAQQWNTPSTTGSTLFVQGATPAGQQLATSSFPVVMASNTTDSVQKEWKVTTATGTPTAAVGDILLQTIKNNAGTVSVTWFNMTSSTLMTVAPVVANLTEANNGQVLSGTTNGRQNFWMGLEIQTGVGTTNSLLAGLVTTVGNTRTAGISTYTVPAGKRLRILHWDVEITNNSTIPAVSRDWGIYLLKADQTGAALVSTSPTLASAMPQISNNTATVVTANTSVTNSNKSFTEGVIDLPAGSTLGVWVANGSGSIIMQIQSINGYLYNA